MPVKQGRVEVEGLRQTLREMKALGQDTTPIKNANIQAAETLIRAAEPLVPVYDGPAKRGVVPGLLKNTLRPSKTTTYAEARAGNARVPYAAPIHWGWFYDKNYFIKKNIMPQPFFMKALKLTYTEIIENYEKNMESAIKKHDLN